MSQTPREDPSEAADPRSADGATGASAPSETAQAQFDRTMQHVLAISEKFQRLMADQEARLRYDLALMPAHEHAEQQSHIDAVCTSRARTQARLAETRALLAELSQEGAR